MEHQAKKPTGVNLRMAGQPKRCNNPDFDPDAKPQTQNEEAGIKYI